MSGENDSLFREREQFCFYPAYKCFVVPAEEVAPASAPRKHDIAGEQQGRDIFLPVHFARVFAVKRDAAGRVPCDVENLQLDAGYLDGIALGKVVAESGRMGAHREAEHLALFFLQVKQEGVFLMSLGLHAVLAGDKRVAQHVV